MADGSFSVRLTYTLLPICPQCYIVPLFYIVYLCYIVFLVSNAACIYVNRWMLSVHWHDISGHVWRAPGS